MDGWMGIECLRPPNDGRSARECSVDGCGFRGGGADGWTSVIANAVGGRTGHVTLTLTSGQWHSL